MHEEMSKEFRSEEYRALLTIKMIKFHEPDAVQREDVSHKGRSEKEHWSIKPYLSS